MTDAEQAEADPLASIGPGEAIMVEWSEDRYHSDTKTTSRSALEDLVSPQLYKAKHIDRTLAMPTTPQMQLGTWTHLAVLEPKEWARRIYEPRPEPPPRPEIANGRAKKGTPEKIAYQKWRDACELWGYEVLAPWERNRPEDAIDLSTDERERVEAMAVSVRTHPQARWLLEAEGRTEQTVLWRHPGTGLLVRMRLDRFVEIDAETLAVLDLKTTADPLPGSFGRSTHKFGYHRQAALYHDGLAALRPGREQHVAFCVVRNKPPHEAAVYELEPRAIAQGRKEYERSLAELRRRLDEDDWLADWQKGLTELQLPPWAYTDEEET